MTSRAEQEKPANLMRVVSKVIGPYFRWIRARLMQARCMPRAMQSGRIA